MLVRPQRPNLDNLCLHKTQNGSSGVVFRDGGKWVTMKNVHVAGATMCGFAFRSAVRLRKGWFFNNSAHGVKIGACMQGIAGWPGASWGVLGLPGASWHQNCSGDASNGYF